MASGRYFSGFESGSIGDVDTGVLFNAAIARSGQGYLRIPMSGSIQTLISPVTNTCSVLAAGGGAGIIVRMYLKIAGPLSGSAKPKILQIAQHSFQIAASGDVTIDNGRLITTVGNVPADGQWHRLEFIHDQHQVTQPAGQVGSILGHSVTTSANVYNFVGGGSQGSSCAALSIDGGAFVGTGREDGSASRGQTNWEFGNGAVGASGAILIDDFVWCWNDAGVPVLPTITTIQPVPLTSIASSSGFAGAAADVDNYPPVLSGSTLPYYVTGMTASAAAAFVEYQHASSYTLDLGAIEAIKIVEWCRRGVGASTAYDVRLGSTSIASRAAGAIIQAGNPGEVNPIGFDWTARAQDALDALTFGILQTVAGALSIGSMMLEVLAGPWVPPPVELEPTDPELPGGTKLEPYSQQFDASGGIGAPYVFELVDSEDEIPPGMTFTPEGLLSGIPTSAGPFAFTVRATDGDGNFGEFSYTLGIAGLLIMIGGVDVTEEIEEADLELPLNRQATARLTVGDDYIPARAADVLIYARDGVTPIFGGIALTRRIVGMTASNPANRGEIDCVDYSIYFDDAEVTIVSAVTQDLEDVIAEIVSQALAIYGITYTPTATGKTVPPIEWVAITVTDAFKRITDGTGVVFRVLPLKALDVFTPLDAAAPVSITDATINAFDLSWADPANLPRNTVDLLCGPSGNFVTEIRWTVAAMETEWEVDIQAAIGGWQQGYVTEFGSPDINRTVSTPADGNGYYFWDDTDGKGTISIGVGAAPAPGTVIGFNYTAVFPFHAKVSVGSPPAPPITFREAHPEIVTLPEGIALATRILEREGADSRELEVFTDVDGFLPGQALDVNTAHRGGLVAEFLVAAVRASIVNSELWEYRIACQESTEYSGSFVEQWKALTSGASSASSAAPPTLPTPGGGDIFTDGRNAFAADQSMGGNKLTNVDDPAAPQDAATKAYVDSAAPSGVILADGSVPMAADLDLDGFAIVNVLDPVADQDAATKAYVDGATGGAGADGLVLLGTYTAAAAASLDMTTRNTPGQSGALFASDFDSYLIEIIGLLPATNNVGISTRFSTNGGSSWASGASDYRWSFMAYGSGGPGNTASTGAAQIALNGFTNYTNSSTKPVTGTLRLYNPRSTTAYKMLAGHLPYWDLTPTFVTGEIIGAYQQTTAIDAMQFFATSGNLDGTVRVYGLSKTGGSAVGGSLVLLESHTASSSATLDFVTRNANGQSGATFQADFDTYVFEIVGCLAQTNGAQLGMRISTNGGSSWPSGASDYKAGLRYDGSHVAGGSGAGVQAQLNLIGTLSNAAAGYASGTLKLYNPLSTVQYKHAVWGGGFFCNDANFYHCHGAGAYVGATSAINAARFFMTSGNIVSGIIRCYGVRG